MVLTAADVALAIGGRLLNGSPETIVPGFSIDSRTLKPGELYVAIKGDRFDGHAFVSAALAAGACGAVVSTPPAVSPGGLSDRLLLATGDTTRALQALARSVRRRSGARVVAITGSAGKTTTKEIAAAFVSLRHRVMRSTGNLNNHIGLPLSLLELRHGAEVAVVELGMNHAGEIRTLVGIAEPDVRVWTNVAEVHREFFDSIEAIADAKAEVLEGAASSTVLVANGDDRLVVERIRNFPGRTVMFSMMGGDDAPPPHTDAPPPRTDAPPPHTDAPPPHTDVPPPQHGAVVAGGVEDLGLDGMRATVQTPAGRVDWRIPLLGRGNLMNSLAALAVGLEFEVPVEAMRERAASLEPAAHRGQVSVLGGGVTVVDDAYNSNPRALQGALAVLAAETRHARRLAVLGEMLELGAESARLHEACGTAAAASGLSAIVVVGGEPARALARAAVAAGMDESAVRYVATSDEAAELAERIVRPGDVVLVKGSRGVRTERVVERLKAVFGQA